MTDMIITHIEQFDIFVRFYGQLLSKILQSGIVQRQIEELIANGRVLVPTFNQLKIGMLCIAKRNQTFYRAIVLAINNVNDIFVQYIDYGDCQLVPVQEIRMIPNTHVFIRISPLAHPFILSGIYFNWKHFNIQEMLKELLDKVVKINTEFEFQDKIFVRIISNKGDLTDYLLKLGLGFPISVADIDQRCRQLNVSGVHSSLPLTIPPISMPSPAVFSPNMTFNSNIFKNMNFERQPLVRTPFTLPTPALIPINCSPASSYSEDLQYNPFRAPKTASDIIKQQISQPSPPSATSLPQAINSSPKRSVMTFKSNTLMIGSYYDVKVCYVENGPCLFSVHLQSTLDELDLMTSELENIKLINLQEKPSIGMACIARFSEDGQLYRAVIMDIKLKNCQVAYVDYGNNEYVSYKDIYEIPSQFLEPKIFAIRFALSGYQELEPIDERIKLLFKNKVLYNNLRLKVMPLEGPPLVQYCELYTNDDNKNLLKFLKETNMQKLEFKNTEVLNNNDMVVIRFVETPRKFFVQKVVNIEKFDKMMDKLYYHCTKYYQDIKQLENGTACAVKFENAWYRAEIISFDDTYVLIKHVDFGNERKVSIKQLCYITEEFIKLPSQAIPCCLKGFENTETITESIIVQLEMLAEGNDPDRRHFKCQLYDRQQNGTSLVNLIDDSIRPELNLMKKLLKLSMPFLKYIDFEKKDGNLSSSSNNIDNSDLNATASVTSSNAEKQYQHNKYQKSNNSDSDNMAYGQDSATNSDYRSSRRGNTSRSFNEHSRRGREKSFESYKVKPNLAPRFQKQQQQQPENKRYKESKSQTRPRSDVSSSSSSTTSSSKPNKRPAVTFSDNNEVWEQTIDNNTSTNKDDIWGDNNDQQPSQQQQTQRNNSTLTKSFQSKQQLEEFLSFKPNIFKKKDDMNNLPQRENVVISWWITPHTFYTHNQKQIKQFENMMKEMQLFYKNKPSVQSSLPDNYSDCIIRNNTDKIFYRAKILAHNQNLKKYRVELCDFGNCIIINYTDVWLIEKRFTKLPIMALQCSFDNILLNLRDDFTSLSYIEKYLKPGKILACDYLRKDCENDIYYVEIDCDGKSLKDLLIQDEIIIGIQDLNLKLLSGQQINAKITSVKDLLNFQIETDGCEIKFLCSYNDIKFVKSNPNLSTEFKNTYEGATCIMDIIDVTRNNILMVQPLIPLFNINIPNVICDYPIMNEFMDIKIAHIETINMLFVHSLTGRYMLYQLLDEMFEYYENQGEVPDKIIIGSLCAAKSSDENWYRARIISNKNNIVTVQYIDYGNTEEINNEINNKLKILNDKFLKLSALAIRCFLPIKKSSNNSINDETILNEMKNIMMNDNDDTSSLILNILERYKTSWIVDIKINDEDDKTIIDILYEKSYILLGKDYGHINNIIDNINDQIDNRIKRDLYYDEFNNHEQVQEQEQHQEEKEQKQSNNNTNDENTEENYNYNEYNEIDNMERAYLSHCDNPGRFFLHLIDNYHELQELQDNIQIVANSLPQLNNIKTGDLCITLYSVDETWYRAKILDNEIMVVQFIDYGNTDVVTDNTLIKEMNEAFENIKPFAIPCALPIAPKSTTDWIDDANKIFNDSYDKEIYFKYISKNDKKNYIKLIIDGENITEKLIEINLARRLEVIESDEKCFVSHINNLSDFYIQLERDTDGLELIACYLSNSCNFSDVTYFVKGLIYAAVFEDDGQWYRALLIDIINDDEYEVLFIDYGNKAVVKEIKKISDDIANLPYLSKKCSLYMPDYVLGWSELAEKKFIELTGMGQTTFIVKLIEPNDNAIIELYTIDNQNILNELEILCDKRPPNKENNTTITITTDDDDDDDNYNYGDYDILNDNKNNELLKKVTDEEEHVDENNDDGDNDNKVEDKINFNEAIITYVNSPTDFYLQSLPNKILENIEHTINSNYDNNTLEILNEPKINDLCIAVSNKSSLKYRAKLLSEDINNEKRWKVFYIDYGNIDETKKLYELPENLKDIPPQAYNCEIYNPDMISLNNFIIRDIFKKVIQRYFFGNLSVEIIKKNINNNNNLSIVKLHNLKTKQDVYDDIKNEYEKIINSSNYKNKYENINLDHHKDLNINVIEEFENYKSLLFSLIKENNDETLDYKKGIICFTNSINDFYMNLHPQTILDDITLTLNDRDDFIQIEENLQINQLYIGIFDNDSLKYRVKLLSEKINNEKRWKVLFIDYGNIDETTILYELPDNLKDIPPQAYNYELYNPDMIEFNDSNVIEKFNDIIKENDDKFFYIDIINKTNNEIENNNNEKLIIRLLTNDKKDIYEEIKNEYLMKKNMKYVDENSNKNDLSDNDNEYKSVLISHIEGPTNFYVQYRSDNYKLENIIQKLSKNKLDELSGEDIKIHDIYAVLHPKLDCYCRGKIIRKYDEFYKVYFIDIGSIELCNDIKILPDDIKYDDIAKNCTLKNHRNNDCDENNETNDLWNYHNISKLFSNIINSHFGETFHMKIINDNDLPWYVELYYHDKNILNELISEMNKDKKLAANDNNGESDDDDAAASEENNDKLNDSFNVDFTKKHYNIRKTISSKKLRFLIFCKLKEYTYDTRDELLSPLSKIKNNLTCNDILKDIINKLNIRIKSNKTKIVTYDTFTEILKTTFEHYKLKLKSLPSSASTSEKNTIDIIIQEIYDDILKIKNILRDKCLKQLYEQLFNNNCDEKVYFFTINYHKILDIIELTDKALQSSDSDELFSPEDISKVKSIHSKLSDTNANNDYDDDDDEDNYSGDCENSTTDNQSERLSRARSTSVSNSPNEFKELNRSKSVE